MKLHFFVILKETNFQTILCPSKYCSRMKIKYVKSNISFFREILLLVMGGGRGAVALIPPSLSSILLMAWRKLKNSQKVTNSVLVITNHQTKGALNLKTGHEK